MPIELNGEYAAVSEVAIITGWQESYVKRLLKEGRMDGVKFGRDWLIKLTEGNPTFQGKEKEGLAVVSRISGEESLAINGGEK
jgi:excisionase family DNA binding protein